jgi:HEAT repeat protein
VADVVCKRAGGATFSCLPGCFVVVLLFALGASEAAVAESYFSRIDAAPLVVVGRVAAENVAEDPGLVAARVTALETLKGKSPSPLLVVQELVFDSDVPILRRGEERLLSLEPLPLHSNLAGRLPAGFSYWRLLGGRRGLRPASAAATARAYVAASKQAKEKRSRARLDVWIEALRDADLGDDAMQSLASVPTLAADLDEERGRRLGRILASPETRFERRLSLLELVRERRLRSLQNDVRGLLDDARLAPFARRTLVALGEAVSLAAVEGDLAASDARVRMAALHSAASLPKEERLELLDRVARADPDDGCRREAIRQLGGMGSPALPRLVVLLRDPEQRIAYSAAQAVADVGGGEAVAVLASQFESGTYEGQVASVFTLSQMGTAEALRVLEQVHHDPPDPRLRTIVEVAVGGKGHGH